MIGKRDEERAEQGELHLREEVLLRRGVDQLDALRPAAPAALSNGTTSMLKMSLAKEKQTRKQMTIAMIDQIRPRAQLDQMLDQRAPRTPRSRPRHYSRSASVRRRGLARRARLLWLVRFRGDGGHRVGLAGAFADAALTGAAGSSARLLRLHWRLGGRGRRHADSDRGARGATASRRLRRRRGLRFGVGARPATGASVGLPADGTASGGAASTPGAARRTQARGDELAGDTGAAMVFLMSATLELKGLSASLTCVTSDSTTSGPRPSCGSPRDRAPVRPRAARR